jgi:acyl-CoA carboxylase subunit beta
MSTTDRTQRSADLSTRPLEPLPSPVTSSPSDPLGFPGYADKLAALRDAGDAPDGGDAPEGGDAAESVRVGLTELGGEPVVAAVGDFRFLGGSMGREHGDRVAHAMAAALELEVPFVAAISSGGARMQEGMFSLVQMSRAAEGVRRLREAGVPVLARFRHPTTGGVHASYGALADVIVADAGATVGFAGPRVVEAFTGDPVGDDSHHADASLRDGAVDEVADPADADDRLGAWVRLLHPRRRDGDLPDAEPIEEPVVEPEAWEAVRRARRTDRPSARDLLGEVFDEHLELHGDRAGHDDPAVVAAVGRLGRRSVVVVGFDRRGLADGPNRRPGQATAAGFRKATRALVLARRSGLPVVTFIDTAGADPSPESDRAGLANAIAETFVATLSVEQPTVAVVTGEGGSGGALALGCTDRLLMQDDAVFEVIAPEGAAAILHRDASRAEEVAPMLRPTASDLRRLGIADRVLPGPTTHDPGAAAAALRAQLSVTLRELDADPGRLDARRARYGPTPA